MPPGTTHSSPVPPAPPIINPSSLPPPQPTTNACSGVSLWVLSVLGRFVSAFQLALGLWMLAFTAPVVYTR